MRKKARPRPSWVELNRLRTGVGLFRSTMHKWGLIPSANCRCGAEEQTADHILASCFCTTWFGGSRW